MTGGFVDEGCSEGGVSGESKCAAAHRGVVGEVNKSQVMVLYMWLEIKHGKVSPPAARRETFRSCQAQVIDTICAVHPMPLLRGRE